MAEPVPDEVYRAALEAKGRAGVPEASDTAIAEYVTSMLAPGRGAGVRAAVEVAYRAGYADGHAEWCPGCNDCGPHADG